MIFLSLLSITLGCALQTVFVSTLVALFAPQLALRGPDGSLHDAVDGLHKWNSVVLGSTHATHTRAASLLQHAPRACVRASR